MSLGARGGAGNDIMSNTIHPQMKSRAFSPADTTPSVLEPAPGQIEAGPRTRHLKVIERARLFPTAAADVAAKDAALEQLKTATALPDIDLAEFVGVRAHVVPGSLRSLDTGPLGVAKPRSAKAPGWAGLPGRQP